MSIYRTRRSLKPVAMDPSREVPREVLLELLEDADWAPIHGLTQPWRFHVFATRAARVRLVDGLQSLYDVSTPAAKRGEAKRAKLAAAPRHARWSSRWRLELCRAARFPSGRRSRRCPARRNGRNVPSKAQAMA